MEEFKPRDWARSLGRIDFDPQKKLAGLPAPAKETRPEVSPSGATIVVIPDAHARPNTSNARFDALGNALVDWAPDYLIDIGDAVDMPSLSNYGDVIGERYADDIASGLDARERMLAPAREYNKGRRQSGRLAFTKPGRMHYMIGNHEDRINRAVSEDPVRLEGVISISDLRAEEYGFEVHPFGTVKTILGVSYSHFFPSGVMGRPVGGLNHAASLVRTQLCSSVAGHAHTFDYSERVRASDGKRIIGISCGCFFDYQMDWTSPQVNAQYRKGILVMRDVCDGSFDVEWWSMERLLRKYL